VRDTVRMGRHFRMSLQSLELYRALTSELLFRRETDGGDSPEDVEASYVERLDDLWWQLSAEEQAAYESELAASGTPSAPEQLGLVDCTVTEGGGFDVPTHSRHRKTAHGGSLRENPTPFPARLRFASEFKSFASELKSGTAPICRRSACRRFDDSYLPRALKFGENQCPSVVCSSSLVSVVFCRSGAKSPVSSAPRQALAEAW